MLVVTEANQEILSLTSWVTHGEEELTVMACKLICVPDGLVKERWQLGLKSIRAGTGHDLIREGDV